MITIEQAYERYLIKVEQNITNDNIATDKGRFVTLFNESQNKFIENHLQSRGTDDVRYIQNFLVLDTKIPHSSRTLNHFNFSLPENYLDLSTVMALAAKEKCKNQKLYLFETRTENVSELLQDEDNKPSFKWRESFYTVNSNTVSVYTDDTFTIDNILLSYYRYPNQIKLKIEENPESGFDETIKIEWDDKALDRIISMCAGEFDMNENNPRFQVQNLRTQK